MVLRQVPERERADHPDGAVREVEDARRGVGDDEAGRGQCIDAPGDDADDRQREERVHRLPVTSVGGDRLIVAYGTLRDGAFRQFPARVDDHDHDWRLKQVLPVL